VPTAKGYFEVKLQPLPSDGSTEGTAIGRFGLIKDFHGDLNGTGKGLMLGIGSPQSGSAGYVAMEEFIGVLDGKPGSFALQHRGTMHAGATSLDVNVVPSSGSGELAGISGSFEIDIVDGVHNYTFDYDFAS
jgi:hypothetical protein